MSNLSFCAVDLGAESGRVINGAFNGKKIALEVAHRFANTPVRVPTSFEQSVLQWDVLRLWHEIHEGLRVAKMQMDARGDEVGGIGVDTWGVDFGLLDERDEILVHPVHYRDTRYQGWMEKAAQRVPREEIYARTGLQFLPFNTLYQLLALQQHSPSSLQNARTLLFMPDLFHFFLSGQKTNEYSVASTSQLLNAQSRARDEELMQRFGLPDTLLRDIVPSGSAIGKLRPSLCHSLGFPLGTAILAPACHDTASAIAAVPFGEKGRFAYLSSGTWSLMGLELNQPLVNDASFKWGFTNEGGFGGTIRFLKNIAGLWLVQQTRRSLARQEREFSYESLTQLASEAGDSGPFFEPDDARFTAPDDMREAIASFCRDSGQRVPEEVGEWVRASLDSLALKYRWTFEKLEELGGEPLDGLHIVGGGTQNELLSQLTADCLGKPVIAGPIEATAIGNCLIQAFALGEIQNLAQIRDVVRSSFEFKTFEPRAQKKAAWDDKFGVFEKFAR